MGNKVTSTIRSKLGWDKAEAKLIDRVFVEKKHFAAGDSGQTQPPTRVNDYMIELAGRDGAAVKLVIRERQNSLDGVNVGGIVPVLVNRRRTKAVFDFTDPRLDPKAMSDAEKAGREAATRRENERFDARLKD